MRVKRKRITKEEKLKLKEKEKKQLEEMVSLMKATLESTADGILVVDRKGNIVTHNKKFARMWGIPENVLINKVDDKAITYVMRQLKDPGKFVQTLEALYSKLTLNCLDEIEFLDGRIFERYSIPQRIGRKIVGRVFSFRDVTKRKEMESKLMHQATTDPLTGIPNRALLIDRMEHSIKHAQRTNSKIALLFLDLDRFKGVNDTLGHNVGDLLLKEVAYRLCDALRETDTVARWGGDEFSIVLEGIQDRQDVEIIVQRFLDIFKEPIIIKAHTISTTCSIGVSIYPDDGRTPITLLKHADTAMYYAKQEGANRFRHYKPHMTKRTRELVEIENDLKLAMENNQLSIHYQPIVNLETGRVDCLEALLRWYHPKKQWIPPAEFIPIAEDCGLIISLGCWILEQNFKQAKIWRKAGNQDCKISINISTLQLKQNDFIPFLMSLVARYQVPADHFILEVTESGVMDNTNLYLKVLKQLSDLGFEISIDDFGTGYSSLTYLHLFPISKLKIDQSFIKTLNKEGKIIVLAIIALAKKLGLQTVAEGVETRQQLQFLKENRCDEVQGFYFAKPMPADKVTGLLNAKVMDVKKISKVA